MNFLFLALILITSTAQAKQIIVDIPDRNIKIVEHDVIDFEQWIKDAANNKVSKCAERLVKEETEFSIKNNESIPAGIDAIIDKAFARPDYKSRKQRDEEEKKKK